MNRSPLAWRISLGAALAAALAQAGCVLDETTGSGGAAGTTSEGGGGTGGATTTSTTTTTTTMTAPLTCAENVTIPPITSGECDLLNQDCPPGETCLPTDDAKSTFCRKEGGLKGAGKACSLGTGAQECQAGLFCVGAGDVGVCTRPCCPADDQPCNGGDCNAEVNFPGGLTVLMCSYSEQCTLFVPDTCKNGQKCQFVYPVQGLAVCTLPGPQEVPDGGACQYVNECSSMSLCYQGFCHYNCKLGGSGTPGTGGCPAGKTCVAMSPPAAGDVGVCQ